jgi:hypothetical protein
MADGIEHDVVLRVGFLNRSNPELLRQYKEAFDIVLVRRRQLWRWSRHGSR